MPLGGCELPRASFAFLNFLFFFFLSVPLQSFPVCMLCHRPPSISLPSGIFLLQQGGGLSIVPLSSCKLVCRSGKARLEEWLHAMHMCVVQLCRSTRRRVDLDEVFTVISCCCAMSLERRLVIKGAPKRKNKKAKRCCLHCIARSIPDDLSDRSLIRDLGQGPARRDVPTGSQCARYKSLIDDMSWSDRLFVYDMLHGDIWNLGGWRVCAQ